MAELKDLFVIYEGLTPEKKTEEKPKEDLSRWRNLMWLLNNKPVKQKKEETEYDIVSEVPGTKKEEKKEPVYDPNQIIKPTDSDYVLQRLGDLERVGDTDLHINASTLKTRALKNDFVSHLESGMIRRGIQDDYTKNMLISIAGRESSYNPNANNGSAVGWFQFMDATRAGLGNKMSREEFINNKTVQIDLALDLFPQLINTLEHWKSEYGTTHIQNLGLTDDQLLHGMWWRPESVKNFIITGQDDFTDDQGNTLFSILEKGKL